jgi:hypothetical protein
MFQSGFSCLAATPTSFFASPIAIWTLNLEQLVIVGPNCLLYLVIYPDTVSKVLGYVQSNLFDNQEWHKHYRELGDWSVPKSQKEHIDVTIDEGKLKNFGGFRVLIRLRIAVILPYKDLFSDPFVDFFNSDDGNGLNNTWDRGVNCFSSLLRSCFFNH